MQRDKNRDNGIGVAELMTTWEFWPVARIAQFLRMRSTNLAKNTDKYSPIAEIYFSWKIC